jgi:hypothetical protein
MDRTERDTNLSTEDLAHAGEKEYDAGDPRADGQRSERASDASEQAATNRGSGAATAVVPARSGEPFTALFPAADAGNLRSRWENIQVGFVDEPRGSVQQADQLVAEVIKRLAEQFADERRKLEDQWGRGDNVSTEDLRVALQRYRSFFERLLAI